VLGHGECDVLSDDPFGGVMVGGHASSFGPTDRT
jgi:hypothetical protein